MSIVYDSSAKTVTIDLATESIKDVLATINATDPANAELDGNYGWIADVEIILAVAGTLLIEQDFEWAMRGSTYFNWSGHLYLDKRSVTRVEGTSLMTEITTTMKSGSSFTSVRDFENGINPRISSDTTVRFDFPTCSRNSYPSLVDITGLDLCYLSGPGAYFKLYFGNATTSKVENLRVYPIDTSMLMQYFNTTYTNLVHGSLKFVSETTPNTVVLNNPSFNLPADEPFSNDWRAAVWYINNPTYPGQGKWSGLVDKRAVNAGSKFYYQFGNNLTIKTGLVALQNIQIQWTRTDVAVPFFTEPNTSYNSLTDANGEAAQLLLDAYTEELTDDLDRYTWSCKARAYDRRSFGQTLYSERVYADTGEMTEEFQMEDLASTLDGISEATAGALTGITVADGVISVTAQHTIHEIWAYYRWWISRLANFEVSDVVSFDGDVLDMGGWALTLDTDLAGITIANAATVTLITGRSFVNVVFSSCGQVDPSGASLSMCSFTGYTGSGGAMLWPPVPDIQSCSWSYNSRAIEHDTADSVNYTNLTFTDNTYDIHNSSPGVVNIDMVNGGNADSGTVINSGGGTTNIYNNVVLTINSPSLLVDGSFSIYHQGTFGNSSAVLLQDRYGAQQQDVPIISGTNSIIIAYNVYNVDGHDPGTVIDCTLTFTKPGFIEPGVIEFQIAGYNLDVTLAPTADPSYIA